MYIIENVNFSSLAPTILLTLKVISV